MQDPKSANVREASVLYTWVQHRIAHYTDAMHHHLPAVEEGTNLASVLEHCMYCCSSLSRVGLDFSSLMQPLLQLCTLRLFSAKLAIAVDAFHQRLDSHKWVMMPSPMFSKPAKEGTEAGSGAGQTEELLPPYALMEHVPLAVFTNGVLSALNELRHCALMPLHKPAAAMLQGALEQVASSLVHYKHTRTLADSEVALFMAATRALPDVVVSYLAQCFGSVFPNGGSQLSPAAVRGILRDVNS